MSACIHIKPHNDVSNMTSVMTSVVVVFNTLHINILVNNNYIIRVIIRVSYNIRDCSTEFDSSHRIFPNHMINY